MLIVSGMPVFAEVGLRFPQRSSFQPEVFLPTAVKPPVASPQTLPSPANPIYRANPFPKVTNPACRIPLRYFVLCARDCSSWRPDADSVRLAHGIFFIQPPAFLGQRKDVANTSKNDMLSRIDEAWLSALRILTRALRPSKRRENPSCESQLRHRSRIIKVAHYTAN